MKQFYKITLYSLLALLIIVGGVLFFVRHKILEYFYNQTDLTVSTIVLPAASSGETLDPAILKNKRFTTLTNYAVNFDFDNICWRPDAVATPTLKPEEIATGTELATTTTGAVISNGCRQGNDVPFIVKKK